MQQFRIGVAGLAWLAVILQYWLMVTAAGHDPFHPDVGARTVNFFSFFTIQSSILVALAMTLPSLAPGSALDRFFSRPSVRSAIALYIVIVCSVYYLLLRQLTHPQGLAFYCDAVLHYAIPLLYVVDWMAFVPKGVLHPKHAMTWLIYPSCYAVWTLGHGALSGFYPYPFINVTTLGYPTALMNVAGFVVAFFSLGLVIVGVDWLLGRRGAASYSRR